MVSKNNNIRTIKANLTEHYKAYKSGGHWIYASLAGLAVGVGLLLGTSTTVFADTTVTPAQKSDEVTKVATDSNISVKNTNTLPLKADQNTASNQENNASKKTTVNSNNVSNTNAETSAVSAENASNPAESKPTTSNHSADVSNTTENTNKSEQSSTSKTLVDPTTAQLNAAKASAEQVYKATNQAQELDAVAPENAVTGLTISANAIGHGTNVKSPLTLTLKANAKAGDVYTINIPAGTQVYSFGAADPLVSAAGTTAVVKNDDNSHTVTDTFTADSTTTQEIKLNLGSNYTQQDGGMPDVGKTITKTITWSINKVAQTPITFTQTIQPTSNLSTVSLLYPDSKTVTQLLPQTNYVFEVSVNEANGVQDDQYPSARVNSADNYGGSKVTIPVPTGFVLDTDATSKINAFKDATTITQPGGKGTNVIIDVPAKSGNQGADSAQPYKLVGAFDVAQKETDQTLTAPGDVTFSQVMNSDGATLTDSADPWSVTILAGNAGGTLIGTSAAVTSGSGNSSSAPTKLVLDNETTDDPTYLNSFGFAFNSAGEANNAKITIKVPDGFNVTSIQTPAQDVNPYSYMPDTSSYTYTLTLANGGTETGTVTAGDSVEATDSAIRTAVFVPNKLASGSYANHLGTTDSFIVNGHLSNTYDNGDSVKIGDQLTSSIDLSFDANGKSYQNPTSITQTVVEAEAAVGGYVVTRGNAGAPGNPDAGTLQTLIGSNGHEATTSLVYEPTFYFVIPKVTTVASINSLNWYTDDPASDPAYRDPTGALLTKVTGAKVSEFTADNGQTVVKIDYSGTGVTVDTNKTTGYWAAVTIANDPDALPGDYPYHTYIVSPTTKISNSTPASDLSFVENNSNAFELYGANGTWNISTASSFFNTSLAQGNSDVAAVTSGTSDDQGSSDMTFYDSIVYTSKEDTDKEHNATVAINLPTIGDSKGSQYTFDLTGPIDVPTNYTTSKDDGTAINPVVLYSTAAQNLTNKNATAPDTTGYVTADQVTDWSSIRSIIVQIKGIQPNSSTGRIALKGKVADQMVDGKTVTFNLMAGDTGYLQTAFYGDGVKVNVSSSDASVKIVGTSTIKARYHYVDANGDDQYIDLADLSQTLNDNVDTFKSDYPTQLSDFSATDQSLIPAGYELVADDSGKVTPTIVDGTGDDPNSNPVQFGQVAKYYFDGNAVQYELVGDANLNVTYVDTDNHNAVVGDPVTLNGTTDETGNYTVKVPDNYILAAGQDGTVPYTFKAGTDTSDNLTIKLAHKHATDLPKGFTGTTHRTITYTGAPTNPSSVSQPLTWTTDTDEVTGVTTYTPNGNYPTVTSPSITGYTPDKATVAAETDTATTTMPTDSHVTVIYSANNADLTVTYVDKDENNKVVGTPETLTGKVDETGTYTVIIPDGYVLAPRQGEAVPYTFTTDTSDNLMIKLAHKHTTDLPEGFTGTTTRTITYTGAPKNPDSVSQPIMWTTDTDEVTGVTTYTPSGDYGAVTTPDVTGYVPDKDSVPAGTNAVMTTMPKDTDEIVTYSAGDADLTVTYVDVDSGNATVGDPVTITGKTDGTGTYTVVIPDGYVLAPGQDATVPYTFTTDTSDNLTIKLAHKHTTDLPEGFTGTTTRTITYTGAPKNPDSVSQPIMWTTDTDEITGVTTYTPSGDYGAVNTPNITGYVPDKASVPVGTNAVTTTMPKDTVETVTYSAGNADLTVTYVDVDNGNATVGDVQTLNGKTDGTGTYTVTVPANYVLAPGQDETVPYTFTTDTSDNLTIKLAHKHTTDLPEGFTGTTTRTITYTGVANGQNPSVKVQPITWTTDTDEVTGDTTYTPSGNYYEVDTPRVAGYTPDKTTVPAGVNAVTTTKPADANVTVTFKADPQSTTVEYVDDANNGAVVGTPTKLEGVTDGTASWNTDNKPAKYTLATGQAANGTYTFKAGDNAPVQIHLTHTMAYTTTTTTRTIHYVVNDPNYTGEVPAPTVQKVTWNVVTDEVTGRSVATPTAAYYEQTAPDLTGYTAKPGQVAQQALGSVVAQDVPMYNEDVVVTYTPTSQPTTEPSVPSDGTGVPENQPDGNPTGTPTEPTTPGTPAPGTATSGKTNGDDSQTSTESGSNAGTAEGSTMGTTSKTESQNGSVSQTRSNASATNQQQGSQAQQKLPQTNEQSQATVGLGVLGLLTSMLGLVGLKRRKRDDE
ncbi:mucus-binding protein, LPXTG-motif cell wall anchor [Secundilactobacillus silagincola]|uniref:Mucus-binding protein, LPXTG-motif cell wall anchor n=1 Tax=Secundilactobacillus silagincola TaxID=1714681 RepID=A0A1Z5J2E3_9LACO|nr:LPXTG cell wall anchor domain-containing protein [Secundilactobacillus silagincola]GAX07972.1 mucus-binding protein, LPXTG-motif cell wall anchor [Secundilactobacillus silagincola]